MSRARYILLEGSEGLGKTTQCSLLAQYLEEQGFKVLQSKEPGTAHLPLTMELRNIMLNKKYDDDLTKLSREYISQAIRSIHIEKLIFPALNEYDYIIQDRGILSGLAYGTACGNDPMFMQYLSSLLPRRNGDSFHTLYDDVIMLTGDISAGLNRASSSKQEFKEGDAIEAKGEVFMHEVQKNFDRFGKLFNTQTIDITGKNIEQVQDLIRRKLGV